MANAKFGKGSWSDTGSSSDKIDYMRLPTGTHTMRLITEPYFYSMFKLIKDKNFVDANGGELDPPMTSQGKKFFGDKMKASLPIETNPFVQLGFKVKQGSYAGIIDRTTGAVRVLDMSPMIRKALKAWQGKKGYKDLMGFDFEVITGSPGSDPSSYFTVLPNPPEALSEEDLAKKNAFDEKILERLAQPINDHATALKWANERREKNGLSPFIVDIAASPKTAESATDEDGDVEFTPADHQSAQ